MDDLVFEMKNITKTFPSVRALEDINFSVLKGEVHCLLGANGAGKSTLIKVLMGVHRPDIGDIILKGKKVNINSPLEANKLGIAAIYQELSLVPELSVYENIFLGNYLKKNNGILDWRKMKEISKVILRELDVELDINKNIAELSRADQQMIEIAKALQKEPEILIMDEPSATLTAEEFKTLLKTIEILCSKGITVIYISHKLEEIFQIGDRFTVLRNGKKITTLPVSDDIGENDIAELMIGDKIESKKYSIECDSNEIIMEVRGVSNGNVSDINFDLYKKEVLGFYGLVGSGRTELMKILFGIDDFDQGTIEIYGKNYKPLGPNGAIKSGVGLVPEKRKDQALVVDRTVWENLIYTSFDNFLSKGILNYKNIRESSKQMVDNIKIKTPSIKQIVKNLSGGNQQKVAIGKWVINGCDILLLDEPTQGIDVGAKEEVYRLIRELTQMGKSIIIVSSELNELLNIAGRIIVMKEGKLVKNFDYQEIDKREIEKTAILGG
ncbi:ATP-binding cassette domain-containing protein [Iocasia frigidifontis]|uniref:ATP-binding cassette domain-containing protein n=1 Tax=Iocasia fonsfrigidae TaxID=2682810 RepID=A0A8A7K5Z5_9FIRM|nr:sugar ABC transporter ATP-binding protein [Iocasia fonsfrigidae]QTL96590.1 ATP-binding cassette domain-containing protein [Iocasia fonsfrigidae]